MKYFSRKNVLFLSTWVCPKTFFLFYLLNALAIWIKKFKKKIYIYIYTGRKKAVEKNILSLITCSCNINKNVYTIPMKWKYGLYCHLYDRLNYTRNLIGSYRWSIGEQTYKWPFHNNMSFYHVNQIDSKADGLDFSRSCESNPFCSCLRNSGRVVQAHFRTSIY